ncbi:MAG: iron ABC transporter permease, partial [Candidatus Methanomethylophilus sp.]|nr:iron ABC transporter permease [Methanomethylophilus sp.]
RASPTMIILSGIAVMYIFNAMTTVLMLMADPDDLADVYSWQVGSLGNSRWENNLIMAVFVIAGLIATELLSNKINILAAGDDTAKSLGINADHLRLLCLLIVSLTAAAVVSFTGIIGFVGLVCPHICRIFVGSDNRVLIPASAAFGAALMIVSDLIGRTVIAPAVLQVGVITAFIGGPMFIYLLMREKKDVW